MNELDEIKRPVRDELTTFEKVFRNSMKSRVALLDIITRFIIKRKGKQIRPMFVFLSAGATGRITSSTHTAAALIELLHTATLVHDDVVDDSNERRGFFSINALWKNKIAVLVGDYLLAKGLLLSLENSEFNLLKIVSDATREMSEGELLQIEKARKLDIEESVYFDIIRKKTASLIAACCSAGAASAGADHELVQRMKQFGEFTGIAFQLKDDLFDYEKTNRTGKPNGIDIGQQKMTLPLIYLLKQYNYLEKRKLIWKIRHHGKNPDGLEGIIERVISSGGIVYAREKMKEYHQKSLHILEELPESPYRNSLIQLVDYTINREQ